MFSRFMIRGGEFFIVPLLPAFQTNYNNIKEIRFPISWANSMIQKTKSIPGIVLR